MNRELVAQALRGEVALASSAVTDFCKAIGSMRRGGRRDLSADLYPGLDVAARWRRCAAIALTTVSGSRSMSRAEMHRLVRRVILAKRRYAMHFAVQGRN